MPKLFLHIGSPKTGSTALQDFLATEKESLAQVGLIQPTRDVQKSRGQEGFRKSLLRRNDSDVRDWCDYYHDFFNQIPEGHAAFVGTEMLWTVDPGRIFEVYPQLEKLEISTFAILRRQSEMVPSHYKQYIKTGGTDDFPAFFQGRKQHYCYRDVIRRWERCGSVTTISYDEAKECGVVQCLMGRIAEQLPRPAQSGVLELISTFGAEGIQLSNPSILESQAVAIRAINKAQLPEKDKATLRDAVVRSRSEFEKIELDSPLIAESDAGELIAPLETLDEELLFKRSET